MRNIIPEYNFTQRGRYFLRRSGAVLLFIAAAGIVCISAYPGYLQAQENASAVRQLVGSGLRQLVGPEVVDSFEDILTCISLFITFFYLLPGLNGSDRRANFEANLVFFAGNVHVPVNLQPVVLPAGNDVPELERTCLSASCRKGA